MIHDIFCFFLIYVILSLAIHQIFGLSFVIVLTGIIPFRWIKWKGLGLNIENNIKDIRTFLLNFRIYKYSCCCLLIYWSFAILFAFVFFVDYYYFGYIEKNRPIT